LRSPHPAPETVAVRRISKCNPSFDLQQGTHERCAETSWFVCDFKDSSTVWNLRLGYLMNIWRKLTSLQDRFTTTRLRHDFVIGPQRNSDLFGRAARLYHCVRCKSSFLVCGSKIAVLDEDQVPITGEESLRRFNTFGEGPCPVLEAFVSAAVARTEALRPPSHSKRDQPGSVAPVAPIQIPAWVGRPRPSLRLLTRMPENFGR
jgi:hypothetical protein